MNKSTFITRSSGRHREDGIAIILILAFIVILTGLVFAFFSRALTERQVANSGLNQSKADILARSAVDVILGDFKQEIVAGSSPAPAGLDFYVPTTNAYMLPQTSGLPTPNPSPSPGVPAIPNLIRRSVRNDPLATSSPAAPLLHAVTTSASAVNSTTDASINGRSISLDRWNSHYLIPKANTGNDDTTPITFVTPDWVMVTPAGPKVLTAPDLTAIGRYAYAIYDEGGLLDINVAGYPSNTSLADTSKKSSIAFADLTAIPLTTPAPPTAPSTLTQSRVDNIVGWRNFATVQPTFTSSLNYAFNTQAAARYTSFALSNSSGFLTVNPQPFPSPATATSRTDQMFTSRQALIKFRRNALVNNQAMSINSLQFLTHYSRSLNQPSFVPAVHTKPNAPKVLAPGSGGTTAFGFDKQINPAYPTVRVQKAFTRNDLSSAQVGDPLVNKRFALQRLAWLTYQGPSAIRSQSDPDIQALISAGIPYSYLQLGNDANISKYFGLTWNGSQWRYNVHNNSLGTGKGPIMRVGRNPAVDATADPTRYVQDLAAGRDPDFFELLKSAISVGSLGKTLVSNPNSPNGCQTVTPEGGASASEQPYNYNYDAEASVDRQIIQIGANIINQTHADNFPVQINFDDGVPNHNASVLTSKSDVTISGVANLPYFYEVISGILQVKPPSQLPRNGRGNTPAYNGDPGTGVSADGGYQLADAAKITDPGVGAIMLMPVVWNPHDPASPAAVAGPTEFRVVADSATPDAAMAGNAASYSSFFAYASSLSPGESTSRRSYDANAESPGSVWYRSGSGTGSEIAHTITSDNSAVYFTAPSGTVALFPEPTLLMRAGNVTDSNGNIVNVTTKSGHLLSSDTPVSGSASGGGLPNYIPNAPNPPNFSNSSYPAATRYLGFYMSAFPWAWTNSFDATVAPSSALQDGPILTRVTGGTGGNGGACYLTYRMQYRAGGDWITYDTKYGKATDNRYTFAADSLNPSVNHGTLLPDGGAWATSVDPRTSRFGMFWNGRRNDGGSGLSTPAYSEPYFDASINRFVSGVWSSVVTAGFLNDANGILKTNRPDAQSGFFFMGDWNRDISKSSDDTTRRGGMPSATSGWMAWIGCDGNSYPGLAPGLLSQNNPDIPYSPSRSFADDQGSGVHTPNYFADPDGIVRRGMGAFVPTGSANSPSNRPGESRLPSGDTTVGLPVARAFGSPTVVSPTAINYSSGSNLSQAQSRPYFLHRPFRSVAELGCVFSDTPWRNLDFSTSESGYTALLDVFSVNDSDEPTGLVAGKINLNTRQTPVLQAVLSGAYLDPASVTGTNSVTKPMDPAVAKNVAEALKNFVAANGPLQNVAELVGRWKSNAAVTHPSGLRTNRPSLAAPFYDGKLSYGGFSGGDWDTSTHKPKLTSPSADVYSAYMNSGGTTGFTTTTNHNGTQETGVYIQRFREAPVRALAASGQTRTWNLMIDVIAQTGRYPASAAQATNPLAAFVVDGEQRYWVHLAIDRYTGQVIDKQIEVVKE